MTLETLLGEEVPAVHRTVLLNQLDRLDQLDQLVRSEEDLLIGDASGRSIFDLLAQMGRWRSFAAVLNRYPQWSSSVRADPMCLASFLIAVTDGRQGINLTEEELPLAVCFDWSAWTAKTLVLNGEDTTSGLDFLGNAGELIEYALRTGRWQPEAGMVEYLEGQDARLAFATMLRLDAVMVDLAGDIIGQAFSSVCWSGCIPIRQGRVFYQQALDEDEHDKGAPLTLARHGEMLLVVQGRRDLRVGDFVLPGEVVSVQTESQFAW